MRIINFENIPIKKWKEFLSEHWVKLSKREHTIIIAAVSVLIGMLVYSVYEPVSQAFQQQVKQLENSDRDAQTVSILLERYMKLKSRRDSIENEYREVEFKGGALSHLENLVKTEAGISSGFTIKDSPPQEFGGNYEQTPFSVKFQTTNLQALVQFLKQLTHGPHPMILSRVEIQKGRFADKLDVDIGVNSIRRTK